MNPQSIRQDVVDATTRMIQVKWKWIKQKLFSPKEVRKKPREKWGPVFEWGLWVWLAFQLRM